MVFLLFTTPLLCLFPLFPPQVAMEIQVDSSFQFKCGNTTTVSRACAKAPVLSAKYRVSINVGEYIEIDGQILTTPNVELLPLFHSVGECHLWFTPGFGGIFVESILQCQ